MRTRTTSVALVIVLSSCGGTAAPLDSPSVPADSSPSPSASVPAAEAHAIVGEWRGVHDCQGITEALTDAGFDTSVVLDNIAGNGLVPGTSSPDQLDPADPCAGAVGVEHSHVFGADGEFQSLDGDGNQVDFGAWEPVDSDTISIGDSAVLFDYSIGGDTLTLDPQIEAGCLDFDCQWATMVAMSWSDLTRVVPLESRDDLPPLESGEVAACVDLCGEPWLYGRVTPGQIPSGRYQTRWFFGGYMTINVGPGWSSLEDSTAELHLFPPEDQEYGLHFRLDSFPVADGQRVTDVSNTAEALIDWLRSDPRLTVSETTDATIGELPALAVDVEISAAAGNEDPGCPAPVCTIFWGDDQINHFDGIAGDDVYRFHLANVEYSGSDHVLTVFVEGRNREHLDSTLLKVNELLETVLVPANPG